MIQPRITAVASALPPHAIEQGDAVDAARQIFADMPDDRFEHLAGVFGHVEIDRRHVCTPVEWFLEEHSFRERNGLYQEWATRLGHEAATKALAGAGVDPSELGSLVFVSTTGLATPSLDVRLGTQLGLPAQHVHREAVFGRGCAGGVVGLAHAADRVLLDPDRPTLLVVVELCSLTYRRRDLTAANVVSSALFGDGAAAAVLQHTGTSGPMAVVGHDGITWPDSEELMGWDFGDDGMTVVLSRRIPLLVRREFRRCFVDACHHLGVEPGDVHHHLVHPGSSRVLDEVERALQLAPDDLALSRRVLRDIGNASAATVLFILERFLAAGRHAPGEIAALSAMGPGFSAEHLLLRC